MVVCSSVPTNNHTQLCNHTSYYQLLLIMSYILKPWLEFVFQSFFLYHSVPIVVNMYLLVCVCVCVCACVRVCVCACVCDMYDSACVYHKLLSVVLAACVFTTCNVL